MNSDRPRLSIVIPAFNEESRLPPTLRAMIDRLTSLGEPFEIIVVDDGSSDRTAETAQSFAEEARIRVITFDRNLGKGAAVKRGMLEAAGDLILYADADGSTPIEELDRLKRAIERGARIAFGSRAKASPETNVTTVLHRRILGRIFNACVNLFAVGDVLDTQCGFKLFERGAARFVFSRQTATGFSFDVEILVIAKKAGIPMEEVPVTWRNVPGSKVHLIADSARMFVETVSFGFIHRRVNPAEFLTAGEGLAQP